MSTDPFRPREDAQFDRIELDRPPHIGAHNAQTGEEAGQAGAQSAGGDRRMDTTADALAAQLANKKLKPTEYKKPRSTSILIVGLAVIGGVAVFGFVVRQLKEQAPHLLGTAQESPSEAASSKDEAEGAKSDQANKGTVSPPVTYKGLDDGTDRVLISLNIKPRGARVLLDGQALESNPIRLTQSRKKREVVVWHAGYEPKRIAFTPDSNKTIKVHLRARPQN